MTERTSAIAKITPVPIRFGNVRSRASDWKCSTSHLLALRPQYARASERFECGVFPLVVCVKKERSKALQCTRAHRGTVAIEAPHRFIAANLDSCMSIAE